jgi:hypothetical protein
VGEWAYCSNQRLAHPRPINRRLSPSSSDRYPIEASLSACHAAPTSRGTRCARSSEVLSTDADARSARYLPCKEPALGRGEATNPSFLCAGLLPAESVGVPPEHHQWRESSARSFEPYSVPEIANELYSWVRYLAILTMCPAARRQSATECGARPLIVCIESGRKRERRTLASRRTDVSVE